MANSVADPAAAGDRDMLLHFEVELFLREEAALVDEGRWNDWLELFTEDARCWMPAFESTPEEELPTGLPDEFRLATIDDDKAFLRMRVKRLGTGLAHAEQPRSRTRHMITNLRLRDVRRSGDDVDVTACTNFIVFQARLELSEQLFVGRREDTLRKRVGAWLIARRNIWLDHSVLPHSLSTIL